MLRWEDERYVRFYTRDTTDWLMLSWKAQGLLGLIMRKVDRAGVLDLGKPGKKGICAHVGGAAAWPEIEPCLDELLTDGCVEVRGCHLIVPNFIEAQEAVASDKQRKRESRERSRDLTRFRSLSRNQVTPTDEQSRDVTKTSRPVTPGHVRSRQVTPICSVPSDPCRTEDPPPASARVAGLGPLGAAWSSARLPGLPSADELAALHSDLGRYSMSAEAACNGFRKLIDQWRKGKAIVLPPTPAKMRDHLGTIQLIADGEITDAELLGSVKTKTGATPASGGHYRSADEVLAEKQRRSEEQEKQLGEEFAANGVEK